MKIGLFDIDSKLPNLALMKISAYHKNRGDDVEITTSIFVNHNKYYGSKIFKFSDMPTLPKDTLIGGTGYQVESKLPDEIERYQPDYTIYPHCNFSWQRFSVGCIRDCDFCVVRKKEGNIKPVQPMNLNPKGKYIYLLDNNFFASPNWNESILYLMKIGQPIQFEGVDVRILTDEKAEWLNKVKLKGQIHIAWDNPNDDLYSRLKEIIKTIPAYKLMCYVLIGYNTTEEQDLHRILKLREIKIDPFVMPYNKKNLYQKKLARWCNRKAIFKSVKWEDYKQ